MINIKTYITLNNKLIIHVNLNQNLKNDQNEKIQLVSSTLGFSMLERAGFIFDLNIFKLDKMIINKIRDYNLAENVQIKKSNEILNMTINLNNIIGFGIKKRFSLIASTFGYEKIKKCQFLIYELNLFKIYDSNILKKMSSPKYYE